MRTLELIFTTISWILSLLGISIVCNYFDCEWLLWVFAVFIGWAYGKYLADFFKD